MKIKILNKSFPTTQYGYLEAGKEYDLPRYFAVYCVEKMKSAGYVVEVPKKKAAKTKRPAN